MQLHCGDDEPYNIGVSKDQTGNLNCMHTFQKCPMAQMNMMWMIQ